MHHIYSHTATHTNHKSVLSVQSVSKSVQTRAIRANPCNPCESVRIRAVRANPCKPVQTRANPCNPCKPVQSVRTCVIRATRMICVISAQGSKSESILIDHSVKKIAANTATLPSICKSNLCNYKIHIGTKVKTCRVLVALL